MQDWMNKFNPEDIDTTLFKEQSIVTPLRSSPRQMSLPRQMTGKGNEIEMPSSLTDHRNLMEVQDAKSYDL